MTGPARPAPTPDRDLLAVIADRIPVLRKSERKVAAAVLADPDAAIDGTVAGLARAAGVSDPTVIRFCEAVGCAGFQEFRIALARGRALALPPHAAIARGDRPADVIGKVFQHTLASLDRAWRRLDRRGGRERRSTSSRRRGLYRVLRLRRLRHRRARRPAEVPALRPAVRRDGRRPPAAHGGTHHDGARRAGRDLEHRRDRGTIAACAAAAQERGAQASSRSPALPDSALARAADAVLVVETHENTNAYTPATSRLAALAIVDILATGMALRLDAGQASGRSPR
jgi:RpiR family carbohydrate utilization transcriptional regulator